ncbi:MAG TPA: hypothetical protein VF701_18000 [Thermoanaerobaculia bacterium]
MSLNATRPGFIPAGRPLLRAIFAAALLTFVATVAPLYALAATCSMKCCKQQVIPFPQSPACAQECGFNTNTGAEQLPDAVAPATNPLASIAPLTSFVALETHPSPAPVRSFARFLDLHHAGPGDPPLFVYNSAFLI